MVNTPDHGFHFISGKGRENINQTAVEEERLKSVYKYTGYEWDKNDFRFRDNSKLLHMMHRVNIYKAKHQRSRNEKQKRSGIANLILVRMQQEEEKSEESRAPQSHRHRHRNMPVVVPLRFG